jgi:hypothetical protein
LLLMLLPLLLLLPLPQQGDRATELPVTNPSELH